MFLKEETIKKIQRNRKKLESKLKVEIQATDSDVKLSGEQLDIYIAETVFLALDRNFSLNVALMLLEEDYMLEDIPIKAVTNKKITQVRARIIGTEGKTLKLLCALSDSHITLNENRVSIIAHVEKIKDIINAVESLIRGSKQSKVYKYLEKQRKKSYPPDLGLKE